MNRPALLIIDVQEGLADPCWGKRNNPDAEANIASLLSAWRENRLPVIHIKHCSTHSESPLRPRQPGNEFKDEVTPMEGETQLSKTVNSAFIGTGLEDHLRESGITSMVIVGLTTDHCVSSSVRMAGNLGFDVTLVSDATATFDRVGHNGTHHSAEEIHSVHLASLDGEFCKVCSTSEVLKAVV